MITLLEAAVLAKPRVVRPGPRPVVDALCTVMVLIAQDVARYNSTGRTPDDTLADARAVIYAELDEVKSI